VRAPARIRALTLGAGAILCFACSAFEGQVVSVHDGDTITVLVAQRQVKVRLADIDAPELSQAFGRRSRQSLDELCAGRAADVDDQGQDRYGRRIGRVRCAGADANAEQVRRGLAWVFIRYAPKDSPLYRDEAQARGDRRGLWADEAPVAPWDYRERNRRGSKD
jgi:endonuclease YncB( thermonuclease family)